MAAEKFPFLLGYRGQPWAEFVQREEALRHGEEPPPRFVAATFLVATVNGELVGRLSLRHELNDWLAAYGGHIGYAVLPAHRRRGYATEILRQGLVLARAEGIDDVLVFCDETNTASARTIERCGGEFDGLVATDGGTTRNRRYWIR